jgi:membrane protein implicated in regulation of membrane protease activity
MRVLFVTCYIVALGVGGMWLVLPWYTPLIYAIALSLIVAYSRSKRASPFAPRTRREIAGGGLWGVMADLRNGDGPVMTDSAKWAYYAPGNLGVDVVFGSLGECVRSAADDVPASQVRAPGTAMSPADVVLRKFRRSMALCPRSMG